MDFEQKSLIQYGEIMSNLQSAKDALVAELEHARQGLSYYQSRIEALEKTLVSLTTIDGEATAPGKTARKKAKANAEAKPARQGRAKKAQSNLPATGKEFWTNLVTSEPQTAREILDAAVNALGITPSKDELKKLAQRQANALHTLVKEKAISDIGSGRERRFTR